MRQEHIESEFALVFAGDEDEGYARGLAVAMYSALTNLSSAFRPEICVMDNGLSESSRVRLLRVVGAAGRTEELRWIRIPPERLAHLAGRTTLGTSTYARLLMAELLPQPVRRAVYLDADLLVRRDVSPLFTVGLGGAPIAAVMNFGSGDSVDSSPGSFERNGGAYFNAGVLVVDVTRWRSVGLGERALEYATAASERSRVADQDALNAVAESWHELDYRWNVQHGDLFLPEPPRPEERISRLYRQRWDLYRGAEILHFTGTRKPWYHWCTVPGTIAWVRVLTRTGWYTRGETLIWLLRWFGRRTVSAIKRAVVRLAPRGPVVAQTLRPAPHERQP